MKQKIRQMSLLQKLVMLTFVSMLLVLLINILIFGRLNMLNRQIGDVYTDNTNLELLGEKLDRLQQSVEDYVRSRSTNSIEAYYKEEEEFRNQVELLNAEISDDEILLAEKNIRGLSESYMKLAADIIQAKRGRNVKKYGALSEEAIQLRKDISNCIESLKMAAEKMTKAMGTKTPSIKQKIGNLSGGNQQKALLGKWMFTDPDILILDEPTRGIDVGAKYDIYCLINKMVDEGKTVIMISSEMPELLGMCDRIYVMNEGEIVAEFEAEGCTQEMIMGAILRSSNK